MTSSACCFGINTYPDSPLRGCVNDAIDIATVLHKDYSWPMGRVRLCVDERATKRAMYDRIAWALSNTGKGEVAVISNSSHGAQVARRNGYYEPDGLDEIICPADFSWAKPETWLTDNNIDQLIRSRKNPGATLVIISDSCHSDDLLRDELNPEVTLRRLIPPVDLAWRKAGLPVNSVPKRVWLRGEFVPGVVLLSGCESDDTSADATISGRPNGAFTWALLGVLREYPTESLGRAMELVRTCLGNLGFRQKPQASGDTNILDRPFPKFT